MFGGQRARREGKVTAMVTDEVGPLFLEGGGESSKKRLLRVEGRR